MQIIEKTFSRITESKFASNGDRVDKIISLYTPFIYLVGAVLLSLLDFNDGAFECMTPAHWTDQWTNYANTSEIHFRNQKWIKKSSGTAIFSVYSADAPLEKNLTHFSVICFHQKIRFFET